MKQDPKLTLIHRWEFPDGPWRQIHLDIVGLIESKVFLVAVDAYTKWPDVVIVEQATAEQTV